jgi:hypothetical protein
MNGLAALLLVVAQQAAGATTGPRAEDWPAFERALKTSNVVAVYAYERDPMRLGEIGRPTASAANPARECPSFPVSQARRYRLRTRFEPKRALDLDMIVGRVPPTLDVPGAIMAVAAQRVDDGGCLLPKSGLSLVQMDGFLIGFPSVCSDIYPHKKSLPMVMRDLRSYFGERFPKRFILSPCGQMTPKLVSVDDYLADRAR